MTRVLAHTIWHSHNTTFGPRFGVFASVTVALPLSQSQVIPFPVGTPVSDVHVRAGLFKLIMAYPKPVD